MIYIILFAVIIAFDRVVKFAVSSNMTPGFEIPVIDGFFSITYIQNTGAAFGILSGHTGFLILLTGIMLVAVCAYLFVKRKTVHKLAAISLVLIAAGGIGNIIDRAVLGYVVDFLDFKVWSPVFNVADIAVCIGCGLMMLYVIFFDRKDSNK